MTEPVRILFVCLGNIVRSPLGEHIFAHLAKEAGLGDKYVTASAGTISDHIGESPDSRMRAVAAEYGLVYDGSARQFSAADFERFDLIIPMDTTNLQNVLRLARSPEHEIKVHLMRDFDPEAEPSASVPDPFYGGIDGFQHVYQMVKRASQGLLDALEANEIKL